MWGISKPPTSYLHSWNQITTLANARQIAQVPTSWTAPRDVVTRIPWIGETSLSHDRVTPFIAYEEFPLYSILGAKLSRTTGMDLAISLKLISAASAITFIAALFCLVSASSGFESALVSVLLASVSFPFIYYGQAVMSDMLMVSLLVSGAAALSACVNRRSIFWGLFATALLSLACLAKSYAVPFAVFLLCGAAYQQRKTVRLTHLIFLLCAGIFSVSAPVLSWHTFALFQPGHQEASSHSLLLKLHAIFSVSWLSAVLNGYLRYVGIPFSLFTLALPFLRKKVRATPVVLPWWILPYLSASFLYLLATADKIQVHDYYFLPVIPAAFGILGIYSSSLLQNVRRARLVFLLLLLVSAALAYPKTIKAITPNNDVMECAQKILERTDSQDILAVWTDVSRFNSLAYYSNRLAVNVENQSLPISRYIKAGASKLVLDLPEEEAVATKAWLHNQKTLPLGEWIFFDAKKRSRTCALFQLTL